MITPELFTDTDRQVLWTWRRMIECTVLELYRRDDGKWDYTNVFYWLEPYRWDSILN